MGVPGKNTAQAGFTLVELIIVIVVSGILMAVGAQFIVKPVEGYLDLNRRTELVAQGESALRQMQRELRLALPNSVRVDPVSGLWVECLPTVDGGRYRVQPQEPPLGTENVLINSAADNGFDVLGGLRSAPSPGSSVVIYNLDASSASGNAYNSPADNRATVAAGSTANLVQLDPAHQFPRLSPEQRFFIIQSPVRYVCDLASGELRRHSGYAIAPNPVIGAGDLVAEGITACNFSYSVSGQRAGLVTLALGLTQAGETISLLQQVHVENAP